ncbi:MAG: nucleotide sugar dehydrogenase, partial [Acidimicrobiales bacterium]
VRCVESDPHKLAAIARGRVPWPEPLLEELLLAARRDGRLSFTAELREAVEGAEVAMLCVGTPPRPGGEPDLRALAAAAVEASRAATSDCVAVVKSTVPPGTAEALELLCAEEAPDGHPVTVVSNPEFLREGRAVWDFMHPDRVVVGADSPDAGDRVAGLYPSSWPILRCGRREAELVKYASNAFLAMKISFANELARLCEGYAADVRPVLDGVGMDSRIGGAFLGAGPGFGGSCLAKDVSGLLAAGRATGC